MEEKTVLVLAPLALLAAGCVSQGEAGDRPLNVIYILADDMGYADLSCTGQTHFPTPNIDGLASQGMLFTGHYAGCPVSAPSRSALMTGLNTGHTPVRGNKEIQPEGQQPLPEGTYTLAKMFKEAGYTTGAFGKWGLGFPGSEGAPEKMGFDRFFGYNCQRESHRYYPTHLWDNARRLDIAENAGGACGKYAPDMIQAEALDFIRQHKDGPFFTYLAYTLPHAELLVPEDDDFKQFQGKFEERPYTGTDYAKVTDPAGYCSQDEPYATFAAMMTRLDNYVGQVVQLVDDLGLADRTLIVFTSDNGPHREGGANPDYFRSYGEFRGVKRDLYEGGIRLPMIARLPGTVKAGSTSTEMATMWDMLPTFAEIAGVDVSDKGLDGISILPTLCGEEQKAHHEELYWEFHENGGTIAVRKGEWKLIVFGVNGRYDHLGEAGYPGLRYELYNIPKDIHEDHDVSSEHQDMVRQLIQDIKDTHSPNENFMF